MTRRYRGSPTKVATSVRAMVDVFMPPVGLLCKLGLAMYGVIDRENKPNGAVVGNPSNAAEDKLK